jgi:hypothetical protein
LIGTAGHHCRTNQSRHYINFYLNRRSDFSDYLNCEAGYKKHFIAW